MDRHELHQYLSRWSRGLNLRDADDRAAFRRRLSSEAFASMKFSELRRLSGIAARDRLEAVRAIATDYINCKE